MGPAAKRAKHSAPGQYLGFSLQPVRLCYHLLKSEPEDSASIEYEDDVAIHRADGSLILEQTKSALSHNPLSNWSVDLWKTVANWLDSAPAATGIVRYHLYVTPPRTLADFALALNDATTDDQVEAIVVRVQKEMESLDQPPACRKYVGRFLKADPKKRSELVKNLSICSVDSDPVDPIRELLKPTVDPGVIDSLCAYAIGEAKEEADRLIRNKQPAKISAGWLQERFRSFVKKNNLPGLLVSFSKTPPTYEVDALLAARPNFIRQLELVDVVDEQKIRAVADFLRSSADKATWAEAGLLFSQELDDWDSELTSRHNFVQAEVAISFSAEGKVTQGRMVYLRCAQANFPLSGRVVPSHFIHGSFNSLADRMRLGWHADFESLLGEDVT